MCGMARTVRLDGIAILSEDAFYDALCRGLPGMPAHFGRNLDALWDALTGVVPGPFAIEWRHASRSAAALGPRYGLIVGVLREAANARPDLTVLIED
jgi:ribonuclease inhibitor